MSSQFYLYSQYHKFASRVFTILQRCKSQLCCATVPVSLWNYDLCVTLKLKWAYLFRWIVCSLNRRHLFKIYSRHFCFLPQWCINSGREITSSHLTFYSQRSDYRHSFPSLILPFLFVVLKHIKTIFKSIILKVIHLWYDSACESTTAFPAIHLEEQHNVLTPKRKAENILFVESTH